MSLPELWLSLTRAHWVFVGLALVSVLLTTLLKILRWSVLLGPLSRQIGLQKLTLALLAGATLNSLYPARVGELTRAYVTGKDAPQKAFILGTVALEKLLDLVVYAVLLLTLVTLIPLPVWVNRSGRWVLALALALLLGVVLLRRFRPQLVSCVQPADRFRPRWLSAPLWQKMRDILQGGLSSLDVLQGWGDLLKVALQSTAAWALAILTNFLVMLALQIDLESWARMLVASLLTLVALTVGIAVPSVPGRIGIFEYICVLALGVFGVSQAVAFAYGVLLHSIVFIPSTLAGLISIMILGIGSPGKSILHASEADRSLGGETP